MSGGYLPEGTLTFIKQLGIGAVIAAFVVGLLIGSCVHC